MLERLFNLKEQGTDVSTEIMAGITTFMTMSYIIFVQPAVLGAAGMDPGAVMVATCLSAALGTVLMAFLANYPIALAPGMGQNFYFSYIVVLTLGYSWQETLGAVFIAGLVFILLSTVGLREALMNILPNCLKNSIPVGIGLLIALVGLEWSGMVVSHPITYVTLGDLTSTPTLLSIFGLLVMAILFALRIRGAILIGFLLAAVAGLIIGIIEFKGVFASPPSLAPTLLKLEIPNVFVNPELITVIFVFLFLDIFDTIGTLIGVSQPAGFMVNGKLPRARQALLSDAVATSAGALLGTSTITSYIESTTGISAGGKTGLTNIVVAILFLLAIFLNPIVQLIGAGHEIGGITVYPVIAPALIIVGCMMFKNIVNIDWEDYSESIPAFLTLLMMPLTFSITEGISFGVISYVLLKVIRGKARKIHWLLYLFAILFVARYIWLK
ncbi:MAG: NCS2 family permease [Candidatus Dadabacteria bacterium]|jgi:AGZA family xanthine/uracil permease-like MFS transporter|nr:NCS2 family permease [Candidatus Dadabacteria bacterium]MCZ6528044.1 NCS2 family permease [Candidatus Dadabacteria bacterium]MCZ6865291.1 NCS2 family permease [Candidatus Dadabacteria bacterium]